MGEVDTREFLSDTCVFDRDIYESIQPEHGKSGILRTIRGPVAEWDKLNRNKRMYSEKLWDRTLASPYVQEQLRNKTLYGEANHPTDRYEVDFSRVSHSITEMWKVPASNQVYATINILDTPLGRILNTLYEAGGVLGYSSRAGGTLKSKKGYTEVDETSYNFVTFDAVPFPSVEAARPSIVEGVETVTKTELPEYVHNELCRIISESNDGSIEAIKGLIYSLESYDMSREINLLEGNPGAGNKSSFGNEITMSLLRESSSQIDSLKSTNKTLEATNLSLERENQSLRESLSSSLGSLTRLMEESKSFESKVSDMESGFNDTIRGYQSQIHDLRGDIEERDIEIERLEGVEEAFKALKYQNTTLQSDLNEAVSRASRASEDADNRNRQISRELEEAYREISSLVLESSSKSSVIEELRTSLSSKDSEIQALTESNRELVSKSVDISEGTSARVSDLEDENSRLRKEIEGLNESLSVAEDRSRGYKDDLISVICSSYNLSVDSVKKRLPVGFSKSDIYCVCESMGNSANAGSAYPRVVAESIHESSDGNKSKKVSPNIPFAANRRGNGIC